MPVGAAHNWPSRRKPALGLDRTPSEHYSRRESRCPHTRCGSRSSRSKETRPGRLRSSAWSMRRRHRRPAWRHHEVLLDILGGMAPVPYVIRLLSPDTSAGFAWSVEAKNGVWGGCYCTGFHPEGAGEGHAAAQNRDTKRSHVRNGTVQQIFVHDGDDRVGWCQYGLRSFRTAKTRRPTPRSWARRLTGGSAASSPVVGTVARESHGLASAPLSPPSRRLAVALSRAPGPKPRVRPIRQAARSARLRNSEKNLQSTLISGTRGLDERSLVPERRFSPVAKTVLRARRACSRARLTDLPNPDHPAPGCRI